MFSFPYLDQIEKIVQTYTDLLDSYSDPRTKDWFLISSMWIPIAVLVIYFLLGLWIGPAIMETREPIDIRRFSNCYNIFVMFLNAGLSICFPFYMIKLGYSPLCQPVVTSSDENELIIAKVFYVFFLSKLLELVDTFILIVKKKITYLQYYHHSSMILFVWLGVRFLPGGSSAIMAEINTLAHFCLYFYYEIASFKLRIAEVIPFRIMAQIIQQAQFVIVILHCCTGLIKGCGYSRAAFVWIFLYVLAFFALFLMAIFGPISYPSMPFGSGPWGDGNRESTERASENTSTSLNKTHRPILPLPTPATMPSGSSVKASTSKTRKTLRFEDKQPAPGISPRENKLTKPHSNSSLEFLKQETSQNIKDLSQNRPTKLNYKNQEKRTFKEKTVGTTAHHSKNNNMVIDRAEASISKTSIQSNDATDDFDLKLVHPNESSSSVNLNSKPDSSSGISANLDVNEERLLNRRSKWEEEDLLEYFRS